MHVKYADYVIYGNMVMLCAGWESEGSFRNCEVIIKQLEEKTRSKTSINDLLRD